MINKALILLFVFFIISYDFVSAEDPALQRNILIEFEKNPTGNSNNQNARSYEKPDSRDVKSYPQPTFTSLVIIFFILICIKLCCYYGQRPRAHAVIIAEVPVTTIQMPPVTVNEYLGIEINAIGGGVWPAGAGPQQQQYLNGGFVPPTYSGFGGPYGQVQTMPYPAPNK